MKKRQTPRMLLVLLAVIILIISSGQNPPGVNLGRLLASKHPGVTIASQPNKLLIESGEPEIQFWVVRAYFSDPAMVSELAQWLEPWEVHRDQGYLVVGVNQEQLDLLEQSGFQVVIDTKLTKKYNTPAPSLPAQENGISGYSCYRTVEETYLTAQNITAAYPQLASWVDIGDSWEKVNLGGSDGYDLMVLRLTNSAIPGPKPVLFVMASMHAREYAPAELATRFAEYLVENYEKDAEVSWILDTHEIHLLLQANPDGRKQAESGILWRKNTNENYCSSTSENRGADLNRNFSYEWGCCNGSSTYPCSITYRGPEPASEPETQAIQNYITTIFPDRRGPLLTDPVSADAPGLIVDLHSYSQLVLWPWSFTESTAPNHSQLQTLGRKFAFFNGYTPSQAVDLYITDGSVDDFAYGELGLAAYTFELGNEFFEACDVFENDILPDNLQALIYAAKIADHPYMTPSGPDVVNLHSPEQGLRIGEPLQITAVLDDTRYKSTLGLEPSQVISQAEYYVDTPPNDTTSLSQPHNIEAADGSYDQKTETIAVTIPTIGLAPGRHVLFVRAKDETGVWGPLSAIYFYLFDPNTAPKIQGFVRQAGSEKPLSASVQAGPFTTTSQPETGFYTLELNPGVYDLQASSPNHNPSTAVGLGVTDQQVYFQNFSLLPQCNLILDDVENGAAGWTAQAPWGISSEAYSSPTHAWSDSPGSFYSNYQDSSLSSPIVDLSSLSAPVLSFWHQYDLEDGYDYARIEISTDGGENWSLVKAFTGKQADWMQIRLPLPQLEAQPEARIRFRLRSDVDITKDGWHIDDIQFSASGLDCQENLAPVAAFSSNNLVLVGQPLAFNNLSYGYPDLTHTWDFGDGTGTSTERDPVHAFAAPGEYSVGLTVSNGLGTATISHPVLVTQFSFLLASNNIFQQGQPGETITYIVQLQNNGTEADLYQFNLESPWTIQLFSAQDEILPGDQVSLASGESMTMQLQVQIPFSAEAGQEIITQIRVDSTGETACNQTLSILSQAGWYQSRLPLVSK